MHATESGDTLLLHHFDDLQQQKDSSSLGMWAFLATEVMFFGGLFAAYSVYRMLYPYDFAAASSHLNIPLGAVNTAVLLCSSLTMALAVHAAQLRQTRNVVRFLVATMALGAVFLGIKASEWYTDYKEGLMPGVSFNWEKAEAEHGKKHEADKARPTVEETSTPKSIEPQVGPGKDTTSVLPSGKAQLFFLLYFLMTGLHAFHMVIGLVLVGIIARYCHIGWFSGGGETQVEMTGLYWHFIDVVWVFLYPLLYLIEM
jgi:cytochrome c oxidase subunit 3